MNGWLNLAVNFLVAAGHSGCTEYLQVVQLSNRIKVSISVQRTLYQSFIE